MSDTCTPLVDFLDSFQCAGTLTLDGQALSTKAWTTVHLLPLWTPQAIRGSNLVLPGVFGSVAYPRRIGEATVALPMLITGCWDADGDPYADPLEGLQANVSFLLTSLFTPSDPVTGTKVGVLTMPDASTRNALTQTEGFVLGDPPPPGDVFYRATVTLTVPSGGFQ